MNLDNFEAEVETETNPTTAIATRMLAKPKVMNNPIVMDQIAVWLEPGDLLSLRRTCPAWNSSFIPQLRKKHRPINWGTTAGLQFVECMKSSSKIPFGRYNLDHYTILLVNWLEFGPICGQLVTTLRISCRQWFGHLMRTTSDNNPLDYIPNLQELELVMDANFTFNDFPSNGAQLKLPNLKRFTFRSDARFDSTISSIYSKCVLSIIGNAPQLEQLKFPSCQMTENETLLHNILQTTKSAYSQEHKQQILRILKANQHLMMAFVRHRQEQQQQQQQGQVLDLPTALGSIFAQIRDLLTVKILQLKHLTIADLQSSILGVLIDLSNDRLRLNSLTVGLTGGEWTNQAPMELLFEFLVSQSPTLHELAIELSGNTDAWITGRVEGQDERPDCVVPIALPHLGQLQSLATTRPKNHRIEIELRFDGDNFASNFPALKNLKLDFLYGNLEGASAFCHPGITNLSIVTSTKYLTMLSVLWPSVTRLELFVVHNPQNMDPGGPTLEDALASIWTLWPGLIKLKLEIRLSSATLQPDSLLTGIPYEDLAPFQSSAPHFVLYSLDELDDFARNYKTRPGLTDLKLLQELELGWTDNLPPFVRGQLSHVGVCLGLGLAVTHSHSILHRILIRATPPAYCDHQSFIRFRTFLKNVCSSHALINLRV